MKMVLLQQLVEVMLEVCQEYPPSGLDLIVGPQTSATPLTPLGTQSSQPRRK